jgi:predicted dehydrogenase
MKRKLKMGMIGGGPDAFIGGVHRMAAQLDGQIELVCGAFSSDPEKSKITGKSLFLADDRVYGSYEEMILQESKLDATQRMDFVSIVTPNHLHYAPVKLALENGFHVVCDKPATLTLNQAVELESIVKKTGLVFALTHNYTGYPMVKQAREMVANKNFGKIRKIVVEYPQGWLATRLEDTGQKQASWRSDPSKSGVAGAIGDIGTHAENLAEYITGLKITKLCADLTTFVDGRLLDDDGNILVQFDNGAKGVLHCSQIAVGEENALNIRVYGEKGGLEWHQQEPNTLIIKWLDKPTEIYRTGLGYLSDAAKSATRLPAGHPEGFLEAFANIYLGFAKAVIAFQNNEKNTSSDFPTIADGVRGMQFIEKAVESSKSELKWLNFNNK